MMYVMCLYQALPHAKVPLVPANGNSPAETTTESSSASVNFSPFFFVFNCVLIWLNSIDRRVGRAAVTNQLISRPIRL
jgi:hypothetical protein